MKNILFLIFLIVIYNQSYSQITFQQTYGGAGIEQGYDVDQTADGGYIISGSTESFGAGLRDLYLVKISSTGSLEWTKTYGGTQWEGTAFARQTSDGGYIVAGIVELSGFNPNVYLVKTASDGSPQWTKSFSGSSTERVASVRKTNDGGYVIAGMTYSFGTFADMYLIKTSSDGNIGAGLGWAKTFGGSYQNEGFYSQQTSDGGYIIIGETDAYGYGAGTGNSADIYLVKTSSAGSVQWTKTYGGPDNEVGYSAQQTNDGGYIITGFTSNLGAGGYDDIYLVKASSNGSLQWTKTFGGTGWEYARSIRQTNDGGYIIAGEISTSPGGGLWDVYLIKTASDGTFQWSQTYGGTGDDYGRSVQQTPDGGYIIAGYTKNSFGGSFDLYLIKTDANGNAGCNQITPPSPVISSGGTENSGVLAFTPAPTSSSGGSSGSGGSATLLCQVLPIKLLSFTGERDKEENIILKWTTSSEISNDYFIIERKGERESEWEETGKVAGMGNSTAQKNYSFVDEQPLAGINYYRLKQIDYDGNFSYSKTISINNKQINKSSVNIYPIPSDKELSYEFYSNESALVNISVIDVLGNVVMQEQTTAKPGINKLKLNIEKLSEGMYFLKVDNGLGSIAKMFCHN